MEIEELGNNVYTKSKKKKTLRHDHTKKTSTKTVLSGLLTKGYKIQAHRLMAYLMNCEPNNNQPKQ